MRPLRNRRGIVGIEAAIVLIAFVVIAAALSYVVINMGFLATQKAKETISEGIAESTSALQLDGTVTARTDGTGGTTQVTGEVIATGDGKEITFTGTLYHPVDKCSLTITDGTEIFTEPTTPDGTLTGSEGGTGKIDYTTGAYNVTFFAAPGDKLEITATYSYTIASNSIEYIVFPVKLSVGKSDVDLGTNSVVVSVYLPRSTLLNVYGGCGTSPDKDLDTVLPTVMADTAKFSIYNGNGDNVLQSKEKAFLVIHLDSGHYLSDYETVKIEVKIGRGAALTVVRTAPGGMSANSYIDLG